MNKLDEDSIGLVIKLIMSFQHVIDLYDDQEINSRSSNDPRPLGQLHYQIIFLK